MSKHISYNPKNTGKEISYPYTSKFFQYIWVGIFCFKKGDKLHKKMHICFCTNGYIISHQDYYNNRSIRNISYQDYCNNLSVGLLGICPFSLSSAARMILLEHTLDPVTSLLKVVQCLPTSPRKRKVKVARSRPTLCNPVDCQPPGPLSVEFSRPEHWSGYLFLSPWDLPTQGPNPGLPHCRQFFTVEPQGKFWARVTSFFSGLQGPTRPLWPHLLLPRFLSSSHTTSAYNFLTQDTFTLTPIPNFKAFLWCQFPQDAFFGHFFKS